MMSPSVFGSRLAHCNTGSWKRTRLEAIEKCRQLMDDDSINPEQREVVTKRLKSLQEEVPPVEVPPVEVQSLPQNPYVPSGFYSLSPSSSLALFRGGMQFSVTEFDALYHFMEHAVKASPNPRNPSTFLKRKQCTFVTPGTSGYEFGQENETFRSSVDEWPLAVQRTLHEVKRLAGVHFGISGDSYNGVHANLYRDGSVGVNPHADKEVSMLAGKPIFSFTLLSDPTLPRPFSIYTPNQEKLHDINLGHGDILVMYGNMQQEFKHGIEAAKPPKKYKHLKRINMTVRAFLPQ